MLGSGLDVFDTLQSFFHGRGWWSIPLVMLMATVALYLRLYLKRYFEYLKAREGVFLGRRTLDMVRRVTTATLVAAVVLLSLLVVAEFTLDPGLQAALFLVTIHLPSVALVVGVLFLAALGRGIIRRYVAYMRGQLDAKPERVAAPQTLSFLELFLKYFISAGAVLVAFFGGLALLPSTEDVGVRDWIVANVVAPLGRVFDPETVGFVVVTFVATYLAINLSRSILEDYKRRTTKFSPRVIEVFKATARSTILGVGALTVILIFIFKVLNPTQQLVVGTALLTVLALGIVITYDSIRNGLAGIVLMNADELEEGERVKIGGDLVCDVVRMDLTVTQVRNLRGEVVFIPNRELLNTEIMNFSRSKPFAVPLEVKVGFDVPHWRVQEILLKAADKTTGILDEPKPQVYGRDIEGSTIAYQLWAYMDNPREMKAIKSELIWNLQELFHQAGVKVLVQRE